MSEVQFICAWCGARGSCDAEDLDRPNGWSWIGICAPERGYHVRDLCGACEQAGDLVVDLIIGGQTARWREGRHVIAIYRPAQREVMLATGDARVLLGEAEAEALHGAIGGALAVRDQARVMTIGAGGAAA